MKYFFLYDGTHSDEKKYGFYIYPWLSSNSSSPPRSFHFKCFVIATCMLGPELIGIDQENNTIQVVKHSIRFFPGQQICHVRLKNEEDLRENPYESALFYELGYLFSFIKTLSRTQEEPKLVCHLPYYDYILFGASLFMKHRLTLNSFRKLCGIMIQESGNYRKNILEIAESHGLHISNIEIQSPFDNLFGCLDSELDPVTHIIQILGLRQETDMSVPVEEGDPRIFEKERIFVQQCLEQLRQNSFFSAHQQVWQDMSSVSFYDNITDISPIEVLLHRANSMMLALASRGSRDYETCSMLPVSEKQIQIHYSNLRKHLQPTQYPSILNLTLVDTVIGYQETCAQENGLLFYFGVCGKSIHKLLEKGLLNGAHQNVGETRHELFEFLSDNSPRPKRFFNQKK